jgi:hypothetical protein
MHYLFVFTQFRTEGYGEGAEPDRSQFSWNCSRPGEAVAPAAFAAGVRPVPQWGGVSLG